MEVYWEVEVWLHAFLTTAIDGCEFQLHDPAALLPGNDPPGIHWIGGWAGPRAVLDAVVKRKIPDSCRDSNPHSSSP